MQFCSMKQGTVSPRSTAPRCFRVLQVFPTMSDCESREHTASCSQDVVEGGFGSNAPRNKIESSGLTLTKERLIYINKVTIDGNYIFIVVIDQKISFVD